MDYTLEEALPKVYIEKKGKLFNVHWDTQDVEADRVLDEEVDYIEGFIDGCVQTLVLAGHQLPEASYGHRSGYVQGLVKETADFLKAVVETVLHTLVRNRYSDMEQIERESATSK